MRNNAPNRGAGPILLLVALAFTLITLKVAVHKVEEGHVGVYWRGGALIDRITDPGFHVLIPFVETWEQVQVTVQTDKVTDIPCGTSGGVVIHFERVEVVNRLKKEFVYETIKNYTVHYDKIWIFDKIHHFMNQFCSAHTLQEVYIDLFGTVDDKLAQELQEDCNKWAPGLEVISIRITKPKIPQVIARNYENMEAEKTKLLIATQTQKVIEKEAETDRKRATIEAEKVAEVSRIRMEQQTAEKEALKKMAAIEDETNLNRAKSQADAEFYKAIKQAEADSKKLTPQFLQLQWASAISNNTKIYFGPSIGSMMTDFTENFKNFLGDPTHKKGN